MGTGISLYKLIERKKKLRLRIEIFEIYSLTFCMRH